MGFDTFGFEDLLNKFENMVEKAKELEGEHFVSHDILFNSHFIKKYTDFISWDEMLDKSGFQIKSQEDFEKIQGDEEWNIYVGNNTQFNDWEEMMNTASGEYFSKEIGLNQI